MLKVFIIDDEYYFRQALKISIPWETYGFEIAGEAKNGEEALDSLNSIQPHITLVDINMPIMDGFEFVQKARMLETKSKFIILTGQSEFSYARQALQLGVFNYILKPIDEKELLQTLLEVKELILRERNLTFELEDLKKQANAYIPVLKERFLNEMLQGNIQVDGAASQERFKYLSLDLTASAYVVFVIDIDDKEERQWNENDKQIWKFAAANIANDFLRNTCKFTSCEDGSDRLVYIVGGEPAALGNMEALCEAIRESVSTYLKFTITIGVGNVYEAIDTIPVSYKEAIYALKNRLVLGANRTITHAMIAETGLSGKLFSIEQRSQLLMSMRIGHTAETEKWLNTFFSAIYRNKQVSVETISVTGVEIASTCLEFIAETNLRFDEVFDADDIDLIGSVQRMNSIREMEDWTRNLILKAMTRVSKNKHSKVARVVEDVKDYIHRHYSNEELRIDDIARHVFINYSHLCYVFKKETAMTINDYVTEVRMNKAKELFDQGERVIQSVAGHVGYGDANYFSKCFKKCVGLTPSKYVENLR